MFFQKKSTKIISALLVIAVVLGFATSVIAEEPYIAYDYDWWGETYPVQSGYVVDRVITSTELGLSTPLRSPQDVFIYEDVDGKVSIFIVDTDNHRIIITDENFENIRELKTLTYADDYRVQNFLRAGSEECEENKCAHRCAQECRDDNGRENCTYVCAAPEFWNEVKKIGTRTTLRNPTGIHVTTFSGETRMYIADHNHGRVLACDIDGNIWMEYRRPVTETFDANASFRPSKILSDNAGNVYVCLTTITRGAVVFSESGEFLGYFGANRVTRTADVILNYFLRFFLSREMMERRTRPVPVEFSNFTIDKEQFIYTVTGSRTADLDIVKKLDPAGRNIFEEQGYDGFVWGDFTNPQAYGKWYTSQMVDISVDEKGDIYLLDHESGKVFQYDKDGYLMFIFGGRGDQKGLFNAPTAIESNNGKVYVLDSSKNSLTVFKPTEFGELVLTAMRLFNRGLYAESLDPWEEVLKRDANYGMAYNGMGNAKLSLDQFQEALDYFYMHSRFGYNRAFKDFRIHYVRENFDRMLAVALIAIALLIGTHIFIKIIRKKKAKKSGV